VPAPSTEDPPTRLEVEVQVDERTGEALAADAECRGISLPELAGHAVLVYLTELTRLGVLEPREACPGGAPEPHLRGSYGALLGDPRAGCRQSEVAEDGDRLLA
jgi:hypothetical protein